MSEITISTGHPDAGRTYAEALDRVTAERDALAQERDQLRLDNLSKNGSIKALGTQIAALQRAVKNRDKLKDRAESERDSALGRLNELLEDFQLMSEQCDRRGIQASAFEDRMGDLQVKNGKLQQRLTAADELNDTTKAELAWQESDNAELRKRVDVLEGLLRDALPALDLAADAFKSAKPIRNKVRAALKPAEGRGDDA